MTKKQILHAILEEIRYWIKHADLSNSDSRLECLDRCMSLQCLLNNNILYHRIGGYEKGNLLNNIINKAIFGYTID